MRSVCGRDGFQRRRSTAAAEAHPADHGAILPWLVLESPDMVELGSGGCGWTAEAAIAPLERIARIRGKSLRHDLEQHISQPRLDVFSCFGLLPFCGRISDRRPQDRRL